MQSYYLSVTCHTCHKPLLKSCSHQLPAGPVWAVAVLITMPTQWTWGWEGTKHGAARSSRLAICKITSVLCVLICTFKPKCRYGSLILIQSISLTSFFQPSSWWGDLRLGTSRETCQTRTERQLVYISQVKIRLSVDCARCSLTSESRSYCQCQWCPVDDPCTVQQTHWILRRRTWNNDSKH